MTGGTEEGRENWTEYRNGPYRKVVSEELVEGQKGPETSLYRRDPRGGTDRTGTDEEE